MKKIRTGKRRLPSGTKPYLELVRIWKFVSLRSHAQSEAGSASNSAPSFSWSFRDLFILPQSGHKALTERSFLGLEV